MRKIESDLLRAYECDGERYADVTLTLRELRALSAIATGRLAKKLDAAAREAEEGLDGLIN